MQLEGKNIILTGASSGIGKEVLNILSSYNSIKVIAVARDVSTIVTIENKVYPLSVDVSTKEGVDAMYNYAKETIGQIDIFIANAGFAYIEALETSDWKHIEDIFSLNVTSPIYSLEKLEEQANGKTVHFACTISAVAFLPLHAYSLYCSSKAALHQFMEAYRLERKSNLNITTIYPVATRTSFFDKASGEGETPTPWPTQAASTVAASLIRGLRKGKKRVYPSLPFRIFYPIGRAFPMFLKMYSLMERRKTQKWLGR